jgi:hypothetical protein
VHFHRDGQASDGGATAERSLSRRTGVGNITPARSIGEIRGPHLRKPALPCRRPQREWPRSEHVCRWVLLPGSGWNNEVTRALRGTTGSRVPLLGVCGCKYRMPAREPLEPARARPDLQQRQHASRAGRDSRQGGYALHVTNVVVLERQGRCLITSQR